MSVLLFSPPKAQFFDANGDPLSGGKVYFYESGTAVLKDTYTDKSKATANANPVILDSRGEAEIWLDGEYKITVHDSADVLVYTVDEVSASDEEITATTKEWLATGHTGTFISSTKFSIPNDETSDYHVGRRIRLAVTAGTVYGVITVSAYTTLTTVTVALDTGSVDSGLSDIKLALLSYDNQSMPEKKHNVVSKTADYTALDSDHTIFVDASGGAVTVTLPSVVPGKEYVIKKTDSSSNAVTVDGNGAETIDGETTQLLTAQYQTLKIESDSTTWRIVTDLFNTVKALKGADVASEAALFTINGFPVDGGRVDVTGTTGITSMLTSGIIGTIMVLQFDGILTITHHATDLVLPNAEDITTAAGEILIFQEYASGDWGLIAGTVLSTGSVTQATIASSAVGQGELKSTTGEVSILVTPGISLDTPVLPGGEYGLLPLVKTDDAGSNLKCEGFFVAKTDLSTSYAAMRVRFTNDSGSNYTGYAQQRYIQASPPYNLGNGDIPLFIYALIDNATQKIEGTYIAEDPPWAYNGPQKINPRQVITKKGKKYLRRNIIPFTRDEALRDNTKLRANIKALREPETKLIEITQKIKNAGMVDIPHPFVGRDLTGKTVALLDPCGKVCEDLFLLSNTYDSGVNEATNILLKERLVIDTIPKKGLIVPTGVLGVGVKWK